MPEFRKKGPLRTVLVWVLCVTFAWLVYPRQSRAAGGLGPGARTSDEAGAPDLGAGPEGGARLAGWSPSPAFFSGGAAADTTELEFPEEEDESHKHLVRDVGIFIVVSAFLAYFLVKVFLEGEEEEPPPEDNGKQIPGSASVNPAPPRAW